MEVYKSSLFERLYHEFDEEWIYNRMLKCLNAKINYS